MPSHDDSKDFILIAMTAKPEMWCQENKMPADQSQI